MCLSIFSRSLRSLYLSTREIELSIALNGVRNSCEAMDTNLDFKSLSSRSFSSAFLDSSSAFLRSLISFSSSWMVCGRVHDGELPF